jgi:hypothetical protein
MFEPDPKLPGPDPDPAEEEPRYPLLDPEEPGPDVTPLDPQLTPSTALGNVFSRTTAPSSS